jgi:kynurenine formamidase
VRYIDLTQTIEEGMPVYPGDDKTSLKASRFLAEDGYNDDRLEISMHAGTHIDGPRHLTASRQLISDLPVTAFTGEGCLLDVRGQQSIDCKAEYERLIAVKSIVLFQTGFSAFYGLDKYYREHPVVSLELGQFMIAKQIKCLGIDAPSPDKVPYPVHKMLLQAGIFIIENLTNLDLIPAGQPFEVIALPLKIKANSSPARVTARLEG